MHHLFIYQRKVVVRSLFCLFAFVVSSSAVAFAQPMIHQQVPFQNLGSSFYEQNGVTWNLQGPNGFHANFGGGAVAPFGNPDPNSGLNTGIAFRRGGWSGNLGLNLAQGSTRTNVSTTPSLTTMDGVPGSISDQTMRPFVTSITPVVGNRWLMPTQPPRNEGQDMLNSYQKAQQAQLQQRMQANYDAKQKKALADFNRGQRAEAEGNLKMARANYRRALQSASGPLRIEVLRKMQSRGW